MMIIYNKASHLLIHISQGLSLSASHFATFILGSCELLFVDDVANGTLSTEFQTYL